MRGRETATPAVSLHPPPTRAPRSVAPGESVTPYFPMCNAHPRFWPKLSWKKIAHFDFLIQLFIYLYLETKLDYHVLGHYFAYGYHYCFLELHF